MSLCQVLVSQDLATFFDLSVWCLSFKALLAWELAISSQLSPPPTPRSDQKALLNFLQPLEPMTTKSCQCFHLKSECEHWFEFCVAWTMRSQECNVLSGTENRMQHGNCWFYFPVTSSRAWLNRNMLLGELCSGKAEVENTMNMMWSSWKILPQLVLLTTDLVPVSPRLSSQHRSSSVTEVCFSSSSV